jgi:hypothetical protein
MTALVASVTGALRPILLFRRTRSCQAGVEEVSMAVVEEEALQPDEPAAARRAAFNRWQNEQRENKPRKEFVPPLVVQNDFGDPSISVYSGPVEGADRVIAIMHNHRAGRELSDGLLPADGHLGKTNGAASNGAK